MSAQYTIGLDYGTNSVRALIVNVTNGKEIGTAVWNYEHGTAGVTLSRDPNLARQHPADYVKGAEISIRRRLPMRKEGPRLSQNASLASAWTRRAAPPCRWMRTVNRSRSRKSIPKIRLRWRGCGKTTLAWLKRPRSRAWRNRFARGISPSAAGRIRANGFSARFCIVSARRRKFSTRPIRGWNWPLRSGGAHLGTEVPDKLTVGVCAAGHKRCSMPSGAVIRTQNSFPGLIRSWALCARDCVRPPARLTRLSADSRRIGRTARDCLGGFLLPWARSMRIWAESVRASRRARS